MYTPSAEVPIWNVLSVTRYFKSRIFLLGMVLSSVLVYGNSVLLPDKYEASALMKVNFKEWESVIYNRDTSSTRDQSQQILSLASTELLSRQNLGSVLDKLGPPPKVEPGMLDQLLSKFGYGRKQYSKDNEISYLQSAIILQVDPSNPNLYKVKFRDEDPDYANDIVNGLIATYINTQRKDLDKGYSAIIKTLEDQLALVTADIARVELDTSSYVKQNPTAVETTASIAAARGSVRETEFLIKELEQRQSKLANLLAGEPETLKTPVASSIVTNDELIRKKLSELAEKKTRMSDLHPEVQALVSEIFALRKTSADNSTKFAVTPNPEYKRIKYELGQVQSALTRAYFQRTELSNLIAKSKLTGDDTKVKSNQALIDKLVMDRTSTEARLVNEKIRKEIVGTSAVPFIEIIDKSSSSSLLFKARYMLMVLGLIIGTLLSVFYYMVKSYFLLNKLQSMYGVITELPAVLHSKLVGESIDKETGLSQRTYTLTYNNPDLIKLIGSTSKDFVIGISNPKSTAISTYLANGSTEEMVMIELAQRSTSNLNRLGIAAISALGYGAIISVILVEAFHSFFVTIP